MCLSCSCSFGSDGRELGAVTRILSGRSVKQGPVQQTPVLFQLLEQLLNKQGAGTQELSVLAVHGTRRGKKAKILLSP